MATAFDGSYAPDYLESMPCGGVPLFDEGSGCAYRCDACGAVIGSIAMPIECKQMLDEKNAKEKAWKLLSEKRRRSD